MYFNVLLCVNVDLYLYFPTSWVAQGTVLKHLKAARSMKCLPRGSALWSLSGVFEFLMSKSSGKRAWPPTSMGQLSKPKSQENGRPQNVAYLHTHEQYVYA